MRDEAMRAACSFPHPVIAAQLVLLLEDETRESETRQHNYLPSVALEGMVRYPDDYPYDAPLAARLAHTRKLRAWWLRNKDSLDWEQLRKAR